MDWKKYKRKFKEPKKKEEFNTEVINVTLKTILKKVENIDDLVVKEISIEDHCFTVMYISSIVDASSIQEKMIDPISDSETTTSVFKKLNKLEKINNQDQSLLLHELASGFAFLFNSLDENIIYKLPAFNAPERSITAPENETTILGPQDAFVESIETNMSLIRRRIRSTELKSKSFFLGTETKNSVSIVYLGNLANKENVDRVIVRLENVEYDGFIGMPVLKQLLEDNPFSPFPQFGITVRTDWAVNELLNGKILVLLNGSPEVAILPTTFMEMFMSPEDFYNRWTTATLLRTLRLFGFFVSILLTSTYVSVLTFHPAMLPPQLLSILADSRARVPFPPVLEVLIIELVIEILREAGSRMPTKIGQTIGIVGGIVIGTAAVEAGLASNILIVLVATTALLSFISPNFLMSNAIRLIRYLFIIAAGVLGMFGQMVTLAWLINHLSNLTSLGSPFISPVIPRKWSDLLNSVLRAPVKYMTKRPGISRAKKDLVKPLDEE
ncbi:spore germination protein [Sutcliffiella cohnii]|uniref:Spore germination protein n=1 Tax=Sutcliffiella cohnii TaxID=33932 RepID=A0A223KT02_9BACI|nr:MULTISPECIES: spore germination protein [Sutcliffiella]AST92474.1 spore germination protein [Sutcliffiella cohnii]WBL13711.1 spore germination protein [Sutcliffiella sp. NC1]